MDKKERKKFIKEFIKYKEWLKIREFLLTKIDSPFWFIDEDGDLIYITTQGKDFCQAISSSDLGSQECKNSYTTLPLLAKQKRQPIIQRCAAGFLGFAYPLFIFYSNLLYPHCFHSIPKAFKS
jgi:hypothetical protein